MIHNCLQSMKQLVGRSLAWLDDRGSRIVYGNITGFQHNWLGKGRWRRNSIVKLPPSPAINVANILRADGYAFYEKIDKNVLAEVKDKYLRLIDDRQFAIHTGEMFDRETNPGEPIYRMRLREPVECIPQVLDILDEKVRDFLYAYYRSHFTIHSVELWRITHVPSEVLDRINPYSSLWHCDHHPVDTLKLFINLSDVGPDDGPFHFLPRSASRNLVRKGFRSRFDYGIQMEEIEDDSSLFRLEGPMGTAAFCDTTTCLHRAGIPAYSHARDIVQFRFESSGRSFRRGDYVKA